MKIKYKELKKWVLIFLLINSSIIFSFYNQITSNYLYNKRDHKSYDLEFINNLETSSYLTYHENFQSVEFNNYSVTNATGWGEGSLHLPHQNLLNISLFTEDLDYIKAIDFFENYVLIADNNLGLKIINFSNPLNPYLISSFGDTYNETLDISIEGKYAYVADGLDGLEILEITDPTNPHKISSWSNSYNITNVFLKNNLAFLSIRDFGVQILNISNPYSISKVGNWTNLESPCRVDIVGNYLFIMNKNDDLEIIDITDIKNIFKVGQLNITGKCYNFQVRGNYLYLANGVEGLKIIDIHNINNPTIINTFFEATIVRDVLIDENYAFLACDNTGLSIVDVFDPMNLKLVNQWSNEKEVSLVKKYGNYLFLGQESNGLEILKISDMIETRKLGDFSQNINVKDIVLDGDLAYLCAVEDGSFKGGLYVINISNPYDPKNFYNFSNGKYNFYDIELKNNICYAVTSEYGFLSLNVSDPTNIKVLDSIGGYLMNFSNNIEISNNIAYVANGLAGLDVYNISDPSNLKFLSNYPTGGVCYDIKIRNDCAFIAKGYEGIEILNISNLKNIKSISQYGGIYNNSQSLAFYGNYLLVADRFDGLEVLDISDLLNPQKIGYYNDTYNRAVDVEIIDNLAIVADVKDGIEIINITNPYNPYEIGNFTDSYNQTTGCTASSRFIYIADSHDGMQIIQYKEYLFNLYTSNAIAQSKTIDYTYATITNATMIINANIPNKTSLDYYISNDNGRNWDITVNNTVHQFSVNGSDLLWKVILSTNNDVYTPIIFSIFVNYSSVNTPPSILNVVELQNLEIWNQQEDFGNFIINLSSYKSDNEFAPEYLNWSIQDVNNSLFSVTMDDNNKDIFIFHSIENKYGSDEFELYLYDPLGAYNSIIITLNIESVNDPPYFVEGSIIIDNNIPQNKINITFEAMDVDNNESELKYSIFYGDGNKWFPIITNYDKETYLWNTQSVSDGNYFIKLSVSDGINETSWISSTRYLIRNPLNRILAITIIATITGVGVALFIFFLIKFRVIKKSRKEEPVI